jgi:hypothetical protein
MEETQQECRKIRFRLVANGSISRTELMLVVMQATKDVRPFEQS